MPKSNMAVYLRHLLGADKARVLDEKSPPLHADMKMPVLANVMRDGIRDAEMAMLLEAGCQFQPGMIIMAPSPEQIRAREVEREIQGPMGLEPSSMHPYIRQMTIDPPSRPIGYDPISLKVIKGLMEKELKLRPYQIALVDAMKKHKGPIVYDMAGMGYHGIQPRRFALDKIYGKSPSCIIADEIHEPVTMNPLINKEST